MEFGFVYYFYSSQSVNGNIMLKKKCQKNASSSKYGFYYSCSSDGTPYTNLLIMMGCFKSLTQINVTPQLFYPLGKEPLVPIEQKDGWVPEPV
jgi:hypothetical protein